MRKSMPAGLLVALVALVGPAAVQAKAPANDNFAAATPLAVGQQVFGNNLNATAEANEPAPSSIFQSSNCTAITDGPQCSSSVWFSFQPSQSGQYTVETCDLGTDVDTVLGVFTGADIGSLVSVSYNDDGLGGTCGGGPSGHYGSQVTFAGTAGTTYHFDLDGFSSDQGSYYVRLYAGAAQPRPQPDTHILRSNSFLTHEIGGAGAVTGPRSSASFALNSADSGVTFQCALDKAKFKRCGTLVSYDLAPRFLHTFKARAVLNGVADPTPAVESFTIDAKPPTTKLASGPSGDLGDQTAQWVTSESERNTFSGFRCSLDGQTSQLCGSTFKAQQLCQGQHTFHSAGYDPASNLDPTPLAVKINETAGPACGAPTIGAASAVPSATSAYVLLPIDSKGAGGTLHLDYGPTAAYGSTVTDQNVSSSSVGTAYVGFGVLTPNTTYHYKVTLKTPFGTVDTGDQTLTTLPVSGTLPSITAGKPKVVGHHAARFPLMIDPAGVDTGYYVLLSRRGPAIAGSPSVGSLSSQIIKGTASGPQAAELDVVDLPPGAKFHYSLIAYHNIGDGNTVAGAQGTFKVPAIRRFKLHPGLVSAGKLGRGSSQLGVKVHGLPDATVIKLKLTAGSSKSSKARKRGGVDGKASLKLNLNPGVRKALHDTSFGFARLRVTALPPGQKRSHITVRLPFG